MNTTIIGTLLRYDFDNKRLVIRDEENIVQVVKISGTNWQIYGKKFSDWKKRATRLKITGLILPHKEENVFSVSEIEEV